MNSSPIFNTDLILLSPKCIFVSQSSHHTCGLHSNHHHLIFSHLEYCLLLRVSEIVPSWRDIFSLSNCILHKPYFNIQHEIFQMSDRKRILKPVYICVKCHMHNREFLYFKLAAIMAGELKVFSIL